MPRLWGHRPALRTSVLAFLVTGAGLATGYLVSTVRFFPPPDPPPALQGVPSLWGSPVDAALAMLADSGLAVGRIDSVRHPVAAAGTVIGQSPLPGRTALPRAPVRVTVSLGPELRSVPDVTRLRGTGAVAALEAGGFLVEVDTVESNTPAGRVIGIEPDPGTQIAIPGRVRLEVSLGPPTFPMPDLAGLAADEALALLASLGLVLSVVETRFSLLNVGAVFGQVPQSGSPVELGAAVRLIVGEEVRRARIR